MSAAFIFGILAGSVLGGSIVASAAAFVLQKRRRARKARQAAKANALVITDRIGDGGQGANQLPRTWLCIRHDAVECFWYYRDVDTGYVWRSPASQQYAPVEVFTRVDEAHVSHLGRNGFRVF